MFYTLDCVETGPGNTDGRAKNYSNCVDATIQDRSRFHPNVGSIQGNLETLGRSFDIAVKYYF